MIINGQVRFGGRPYGKGPAQQAPRRAADPTAGTLPIRLAAADTVIFLDLPALTCLWGILQRRWKYRGGQHQQDGVFDRITWNFVKYIWGYRKSMKPRVIALTAQHGQQARLVVLPSRTAASRFVTQAAAR